VDVSSSSERAFVFVFEFGSLCVLVARVWRMMSGFVLVLSDFPLKAARYLLVVVVVVAVLCRSIVVAPVGLPIMV